MYLYRYGFWTMEESDYQVFCSSRDLTQEQFEEVVLGIVPAAVTRYTRDQDKYHSAEQSEDWGDLEKFKPRSAYYRYSMQNLQEYIVEILAEQGFDKVQYKAEFRCFGWPSVIDPEDWKHQRGEVLNRITKFLHEQGITPETYPEDRWS
jgi:hypothetical protein